MHVQICAGRQINWRSYRDRRHANWTPKNEPIPSLDSLRGDRSIRETATPEAESELARESAA